MAKRTRKNARLSTNFKAPETKPGGEPDAGADPAVEAAEKPAEAAAIAETDQPVGGAGAAEGTAGNEAAEGAGDADGDVQSTAGDDEAAPGTLADGDGRNGSAGDGEAVTIGDPAGARVDHARAAAVNAYIGAGYFIGEFDQQVEWDPHAEHFVEASVFVQDNREAPAQSIPIHLALKKLGGSMKPSASDVLLWGVFCDVFLAVYDHLKVRDDAETEALAAAQEFGSQGFGGDLAMQPQPGAFDPSGFSSRR